MPSDLTARLLVLADEWTVPKVAGEEEQLLREAADMIERMQLAAKASKHHEFSLEHQGAVLTQVRAERDALAARVAELTAERNRLSAKVNDMQACLAIAEADQSRTWEAALEAAEREIRAAASTIPGGIQALVTLIENVQALRRLPHRRFVRAEDFEFVSTRATALGVEVSRLTDILSRNGVCRVCGSPKTALRLNKDGLCIDCRPHPL